MSSVVISGNTSGTITLDAPAVAGTTTLTLPTTTDTLVGKTTTDTLTNKTLTSPVIDGTPTGVGVLTAGTSVSASGTSIDFTGIPSWVKCITVMFNGVSTNGTSNFQIRLGSSGGVEATGYISSANYSTSSSAAASTGFFILYGIASAADIFQGALILLNLSGNTWVGNGNFTDSAQRASNSAGAKTLSGTLDRIRITTVNGTDTFDAGSINILFE
jgi:hypothetical protein